jgi:hypothetical protein
MFRAVAGFHLRHLWAQTLSYPPDLLSNGHRLSLPGNKSAFSMSVPCQGLRCMELSLQSFPHLLTSVLAQWKIHIFVFVKKFVEGVFEVALRSKYIFFVKISCKFTLTFTSLLFLCIYIVERTLMRNQNFFSKQAHNYATNRCIIPIPCFFPRS